MSKAELIDAIEFLKTLSFKKCINGFFLRLSYLVSSIFNTYFHWGTPESLSIEPTNLCNLKCPECPSGNNAMKRPRLFLSENNFKNTINSSKDTLAYLQLFFQGEPFLHPKLFDFISYAVQKNIYTATSTNGQFLSKQNCESIITSGLHRIIISVDGTTQEVYEKYRVGGSLDLALSGIKQLVGLKKQLNSTTPYIVMQFVVFATNEHQIPEVKVLAKQLSVDKLEIKTAQIDDFKTGNNLIPKNKAYSRYSKTKTGEYVLKRNATFKCKRIWTSAVISAEGNMLPCCFDKDALYSYGAVNESVNKRWEGTNVKKFRNLVWSKNNSIPMCENCTEGLK